MAAMVMRQGGTRLAGSMMAALGPRLFSHSATTGAAVGGKSSLAGFLSGNPTNEAGMYWIMGVRNCSTGAQQQLQNSATATTSGASVAVSKDETEKNEISSYWGVPTSKLTNKDGTEWKWSCFRVRHACTPLSYMELSFSSLFLCFSISSFVFSSVLCRKPFSLISKA